MVESQTIADVTDRLFGVGRSIARGSGVRRSGGRLEGGTWGHARRSLGLELRWPRRRWPPKPRGRFHRLSRGRPTSIRFATTWLSSRRLHAERFPAWESSPGEGKIDDDIHGDRLRVLKLLAARRHGPLSLRRLGPAKGDSPLFFRGRPAKGDSPRPSSLAPRPSPLAPSLIVTSIQSLMQPVPPPELLARQTRVLRVGDELNAPELLRWMAEGGFDNTTAVGLPGEFSPRGGIVDVFAPDWDRPGADRIVRRPDRIAAAVRSVDAAQLANARRDRNHRPAARSPSIAAI